MKIEKTILDGVVVIKPDVFTDERGFFMETFQEDRYQELLGTGVRFVQDNLSCSKKGVVRGLHYQAPPFAQGKLIQVLYGKVLDVAVDIRSGSPTFGRHVAAELSAENREQLFIPVGFAHGFIALEDNTIFSYKCTNVYSKEHDRGVRFNDPDIGIDWGTAMPLISEKDSLQPLLKDIPKEFQY